MIDIVVEAKPGHKEMPGEPEKPVVEEDFS